MHACIIFGRLFIDHLFFFLILCRFLCLHSFTVYHIWKVYDKKELNLTMNNHKFFFHIFYDDVQNIDINFIFDIPPIFVPIYLIICSVVVIVNGLFYISSRGDVKRRKVYSSFKAGKFCEFLSTIFSDTTLTRSVTFER